MLIRLMEKAPSLVWADILAAFPKSQTTVVDVDFLGQATFLTGSVTVEETQVGGLSGLTTQVKVFSIIVFPIIDTVTDFSGVGTGGRLTLEAIAQFDTIKFQGDDY